MFKMVNGTKIPLTADEVAATKRMWAEDKADRSLQALKEAAAAALTRSDLTILRCIESGQAIPPVWTAYRKALRAALTGKGPLPEQPPYPDHIPEDDE